MKGSELFWENAKEVASHFVCLAFASNGKRNSFVTFLVLVFVYVSVKSHI